MFAVLVAEAEFQCGEATTTPLAATCNRHAVSSTPINKEVVRATVTPSQRAGLLTHQTCGAGSRELRVENGRLDRGHLDVDGHDTVHGAGHGDLNSTRRQRQCAQHASPLLPLRPVHMCQAATHLLCQRNHPPKAERIEVRVRVDDP